VKEGRSGGELARPPENEFEPGEILDIEVFWLLNPRQLPKELEGVVWPPKADA